MDIQKILEGSQDSHYRKMQKSVVGVGGSKNFLTPLPF